MPLVSCDNCMQDLAAVILHSPFVDMLSSMTDASLPLTQHEYDEWGDPNEAEGLQHIASICPYQNIKASKYPAILVSCAFNDVRVPAFGPAKWVARLKENQRGHAPILLQSQLKGGHFGSESDDLSRATAELSFLLHACQQ